jgi:hypothetical protein
MNEQPDLEPPLECAVKVEVIAAPNQGEKLLTGLALGFRKVAGHFREFR